MSADDSHSLRGLPCHWEEEDRVKGKELFPKETLPVHLERKSLPRDFCLNLLGRNCRMPSLAVRMSRETFLVFPPEYWRNEEGLPQWLWGCRSALCHKGEPSVIVNKGFV